MKSKNSRSQPKFKIHCFLIKTKLYSINFTHIYAKPKWWWKQKMMKKLKIKMRKKTSVFLTKKKSHISGFCGIFYFPSFVMRKKIEKKLPALWLHWDLLLLLVLLCDIKRKNITVICWSQWLVLIVIHCPYLALKVEFWQYGCSLEFFIVKIL